MKRPFKPLLPLVALGLTVLPLAAEAWVFSADVLIRKVGVARRNLRNGDVRLASLEVRGHLALHGEEARAAAGALGLPFDAAAPDLTLTLPATAHYKIPGRCRLEVQPGASAGAPRLAISSRGERAAGDARLAVLEMFAELACPLLDGRGGYEGPSELARAAGIRRSLVTLGRAEGQQIAYVVGAAPTEAAASSLWVSKETFQPLRFVERRAAATRVVRLIDYDSAEAGRWHPRRIEFFQAGRLIGTFSIDAATPNPKLSDALF